MHWLVQVIEEAFFKFAIPKWAFFHGQFTGGHFFPKTIYMWALFSIDNSQAGILRTVHEWEFFTDHSQVGIFSMDQSQEGTFSSLVKQKLEYFPISAHCNLLGYLPTYQPPTPFNFVLFAQNYLIKTFIDPIKLENYP